MTYKSEILNSISGEFYGEEVKHIAGNIFDYLCEGGKNIRHISFGHLKNCAGKNADDDDIILAAKILTLIKDPILEEQYELVIEQFNALITRNELNGAIQDGFLIHPETGVEIFEFPKYISVYYVPSEFFLKRITYYGS